MNIASPPTDIASYVKRRGAFKNTMYDEYPDIIGITKPITDIIGITKPITDIIGITSYAKYREVT